jgi:hypothetical protein
MSENGRHKSQETRWLSDLVEKMIELSEPSVRGSRADDVSLAALRQQLSRRPQTNRQAA